MFVIIPGNDPPIDRGAWLKHQHVARRRSAFTWPRLLLWLGGELLAVGLAVILLRILAAAGGAR